MIEIIIGLVFLILASISSYLILTTQVCLYYGKALASEEFLAINPSGFQDALTDPKSSKWFFIVQILLILQISYLFYAFAWWIGIFSILFYFVLMSLIKRIIPPFESPKWIAVIYSSLARREADYKRDGDELRYQATRDLRKMFEDKFTL